MEKLYLPNTIKTVHNSAFTDIGDTLEIIAPKGAEFSTEVIQDRIRYV